MSGIVCCGDLIQLGINGVFLGLGGELSVMGYMLEIISWIKDLEASLIIMSIPC